MLWVEFLIVYLLNTFPLTSGSRPVVIVDFDDTFFPTSDFVAALDEDRVANVPKVLVETVETFFHTIDRIGEVVFLTSSCPYTRWMLSLVDTYYPRLSPLVRATPIVYSRYHGAGNKLKSFVEIIDRYGRERVYISVSDSPQDHFHFRLACLTNVSCKGVQFIPRPSVVALHAQLECLTQHISSLTQYEPRFSSVTLEFSSASLSADSPFASLCILVNTS